MDISTRIKIVNDNYYNYLKENSFWVKYLSRSKYSVNEFIDFIKDKYTLKLSDRLENIVDKIDSITSVLSALK